MKTKLFSNGLLVKSRKSAIIFENEDGIQDGNLQYKYEFSTEEFKDFIDYLEEVVKECWKDVKIKEVDSLGNDYYEYYDRRLDNNGYLRLNGTTIQVEAPYGTDGILYQFNKFKIGTFLYDLKNSK